MNILVISNMFHPIQTGSSNYTLALASTLHEHGHKVIVVSVKLNHYKSNNDLKFPFKVYRLSCIHLKFKKMFNWFTIVSLNLYNYMKLYQIIKHENIDIVHQVNHYLDTAILTRIICSIVKIPIVISIHTQLQFKSHIYSPFLRFADKIISGFFILKNSSKIVCFNSEILKYLEDTYEKNWLKNKIIMNITRGININRQDYEFEKNYELNNLIVSIGHVIDIRNRITLIKAMRYVVDEFPDVKLDIVGHVYIDEPIKLVDELGLKKNIIFKGELSKSDVMKEFKKADIHAVWISKKYVGLGTAISESMLFGVPVINNSPGNLIGKNGLKNMHNIVLINDNDIEGIAKKIILLLKDKKMRENIGKSGRDFILQNYDFDKVIVKQLKVYNSLIN